MFRSPFPRFAHTEHTVLFGVRGVLQTLSNRDVDLFSNEQHTSTCQWIIKGRQTIINIRPE